MRCVEREKLSPAESSFGLQLCEVRPGVGPVKKDEKCHSRIRDYTRYVY